MTAQARGRSRPDSYFRRHFILAHFLLTSVISWAGALAVAAPALLRGQAVSRLSGILIFPAMLLGPSVNGVVMTRIVSGREGVKDLFTRMRRARVPVRWYGVLLIPPILVFAVLFSLKILVSPTFSPNHFYFGILFGVPAGFFEEIGWTGYGFPKFEAQPFRSGDCAGTVLGNLAPAGD